jgi:hypothetical protein
LIDARFEAWQPDTLDDEEFNLVLVTEDGTVFRAMSVDFEEVQTAGAKQGLTWCDGARLDDHAPTVKKVYGTVKPDKYGVTVLAHRDAAEHPQGEVLVEFYGGRVVAHVWNEEDKGGDPTASIDLFTP